MPTSAALAETATGRLATRIYLRLTLTSKHWRAGIQPWSCQQSVGVGRREPLFLAPLSFSAPSFLDLAPSSTWVFVSSPIFPWDFLVYSCCKSITHSSPQANRLFLLSTRHFLSQRPPTTPTTALRERRLGAPSHTCIRSRRASLPPPSRILDRLQASTPLTSLHNGSIA